MSARSDTKKLLRAAKKSGVVVREGKGGHKKLYVDGRLVTILSTAKSYAGDLNASKRELRRAGVSL